MGIFTSFKNLLHSKKEIIQPAQLKVSFSVDDNKELLFDGSSDCNKPKVPIDESTTEHAISSSSSEKNSSNIFSFQFIDGRRYNADESISYILPNDDDEVYRLDKQHWILRYALQCNFQAPIKRKLQSGIRVLDSGTGPGTWALEMSDTFPESNFYCIDAAHVFPIDNKRPNIHFIVGNIAKKIPFEDNYFDFIHQRLLLVGLTDDDWTNTFKHMYRILKPGGYIELSEPDSQKMPNGGPAMQLLLSIFNEMSIACGFPAGVASQLEDRLKKAGFRSIKVKTTDIPLNHGGRVGKFIWEDFRHTFVNLRPTLAKSYPEWANAEVYEAYMDKCSEEAKENKTCVTWYTIYARKPKNTAAEQDLQQALQEKLNLDD